MDGILTPEDEESLKRVRWTVIDLAVTRATTEYELPKATMASTSASTSTLASSPSTAAMATAVGTTDCYAYQPDALLEPYAILLKRLLKPMYHFKLNEYSKLDSWTTTYNAYPSGDKWIFVDMVDKTLWAAVDKPKPLDDFYRDLVDAEMHKDKFVGCTVDTESSVGLVPLIDLKHSLVDWWCK